MVVDEAGLVHGGFVFGLADYAAMLAVNHPHVVLGAAECRFLAPVQVGEEVEASAALREEAGRKRQVEVEVQRGADKVFTGTFTCFVLDQHVLAPAEESTG
jgi:acyl-coenzyme A thioesterase PaaI-like protein